MKILTSIYIKYANKKVKKLNKSFENGKINQIIPYVFLTFY
jgi:hypothetical protein